MASYRISVGKRHKVEPRQIVGALANEGGLGRSDFGRIDIRPDFSLVELPADLSGDTWDALRSTRISGKLIELRKADAGDSAGSRDGGPGSTTAAAAEVRQQVRQEAPPQALTPFAEVSLLARRRVSSCDDFRAPAPVGTLHGHP